MARKSTRHITEDCLSQTFVSGGCNDMEKILMQGLHADLMMQIGRLVASSGATDTQMIPGTPIYLAPKDG